MTDDVSAALFLTDSEREMMFNMADHLLQEDVQTMEEWERNQHWARLLLQTVLGKCHYQTKQQFFPITLVKGK